MVPLGTPAPDFALPDTEGNTVSLDRFRGAGAYLVMFICNHCPYVIHIRKALAELAADYLDRGVGVVAICSNDAQRYPDDAPDKMKIEATKAGFTFPYLHDADQSVAKAFKAACTPDFFVYDKDRLLTYRGQFDDSRPGNDVGINGSDLRAALDATLDGEPILEEVQTPSLGCSIKWIPGNEPN